MVLPRVVLGQAYRGLPGGFLLLRIFSVGVSVCPNVFYVRFNFDFQVNALMS